MRAQLWRHPCPLLLLLALLAAIQPAALSSAQPTGRQLAPAEWRDELLRQGVRRKVRFKSYDRPPKGATKAEKKKFERRVYAGKVARRTFGWFGYEETKVDDWDLLWTGKGQYQFLRNSGLPMHPHPHQDHNHCFGPGLLAGNKASFIRLHSAMVKKVGRDAYSHVPETYDLPKEHAVLMRRMAEAEAKAAAGGGGGGEAAPLWILKPSTGARGEGIELLWRKDQVRFEVGPKRAALGAGWRGPNFDRSMLMPPGSVHAQVPPPSSQESVAIQRYLDNPFLIDGRKVHLRLYVAVTDLDPLRVLLFRDALGPWLHC